jgi:Rrf2 family transcriptional regulator, cysteine metabolism repressor
VKLSVKSDYAARAVLGLARHHLTKTACRVDDLAGEQGIPAKYLVQILIELKSTQIVRSLRGKAGGYRLARAPSEITLADVLRCVEGELFASPALSDPYCPPELRAVWRRLQQAVENAAAAVTFQQLLDQGAERERMYYI